MGSSSACPAPTPTCLPLTASGWRCSTPRSTTGSWRPCWPPTTRRRRPRSATPSGWSTRPWPTPSPTHAWEPPLETCHNVPSPAPQEDLAIRSGTGRDDLGRRRPDPRPDEDDAPVPPAGRAPAGGQPAVERTGPGRAGAGGARGHRGRPGAGRQGRPPGRLLARPPTRSVLRAADGSVLAVLHGDQ